MRKDYRNVDRLLAERIIAEDCPEGVREVVSQMSSGEIEVLIVMKKRLAELGEELKVPIEDIESCMIV